MKNTNSTESDRQRWDRKFSAGEGPAHFRPKQLLTDHRHLLTGGRALDVACGFGGNALYLASLGYRVEAVDVSSVALGRAQAEARRRGLNVNLVQADLTRWRVPPARYHLISVFFYLNRELFPHLVTALRPGGLLFQAARNMLTLKTRPGFDPAHLVEPGELLQFATISDLEVLHYADEGHSSTLVAQRPAGQPC